MMPSARLAHPEAVAGPPWRFNVTRRAALAVALCVAHARAEGPGWEPPVTGTLVGVELGVLAASIADAREASTWAWCTGVGGAVGLGLGAAYGQLRSEPEAALTLRATAIGLAIPAAILFWSRVAEPASPAASEDSSLLAPRARTVKREKER
jgi:hypothetical protein